MSTGKSVWTPEIDIKNDPKQSSFVIPKELIPCGRSVFYCRYVETIGTRDDFAVSWVDEAGNFASAKPAQFPTHSINEIPKSLPEELFRTKIGVVYQNVKLVTITVHYTTGTVLVQGNKCREWREEEFRNLVACIEAIGRHYSSPIQVADDISVLPLPSELDIRSSSRLKLKSDQAISDSPPTPAPTAMDQSNSAPLSNECPPLKESSEKEAPPTPPEHSPPAPPKK